MHLISHHNCQASHVYKLTWLYLEQGSLNDYVTVSLCGQLGHLCHIANFGHAVKLPFTNSPI